MIERTAREWMTLPLRRYAEFSGRSPRAEYWWFALFTLLANIPAGIIDAMLGSQLVGGLLSLALLLPSLAVGARRLHDIDRTGWWMLAPLVPLLPTLATAGVMGAGGVIGAATGSGTLAALGAGGATVALAIGGIATAAVAILLFVWYCTKGTAGPNRFGDDPLAPAGNPTVYY